MLELYDDCYFDIECMTSCCAPAPEDLSDRLRSLEHDHSVCQEASICEPVNKDMIVVGLLGVIILLLCGLLVMLCSYRNKMKSQVHSENVVIGLPVTEPQDYDKPYETGRPFVKN